MTEWSDIKPALDECEKALVEMKHAFDTLTGKPTMPDFNTDYFSKMFGGNK